MKKIISLILIFAMLMSTVVFADENSSVFTKDNTEYFINDNGNNVIISAYTDGKKISKSIYNRNSGLLKEIVYTSGSEKTSEFYIEQPIENSVSISPFYIPNEYDFVKTETIFPYDIPGSLYKQDVGWSSVYNSVLLKYSTGTQITTIIAVIIGVMLIPEVSAFAILLTLGVNVALPTLSAAIDGKTYFRDFTTNYKVEVYGINTLTTFQKSQYIVVANYLDTSYSYNLHNQWKDGFPGTQTRMIEVGVINYVEGNY